MKRIDSYGKFKWWLEAESNNLVFLKVYISILFLRIRYSKFILIYNNLQK